VDQTKFYFIGGKGGVGKSTTSATLALLLSTYGQKVLLVSTDPAHNIRHIFHVSEDKEAVFEVNDYLHIFEIDGKEETEKYIEEVKNNVKQFVQSSRLEEALRHIDLAGATPGAEEAAVFDRITKIMLDLQVTYDKIIFDTAPTGHTLRLLTLPELMSAWVHGLLERRKKMNDNFHSYLSDGQAVEDPIYKKLMERQFNFKNVHNLLSNPKVTKFWFVLNPERLPLLETKNAVNILNRFGLSVSTIVMNKVIPSDAYGSFIEKRKTNEKKYIEMVYETFKDQNIVSIPLLPHDIASIEHLEKLASYFILPNYDKNLKNSGVHFSCSTLYKR